MQREFWILSLAAALPVLAGDNASGQILKEVIEGAKKEGQVRVYSSMRKETTKAIIDAFRKKYPFVAKVDHLRFSGLEESERALAELRVGRIDMDVLLVRSELWDRHKPFLAGPIDWKALDVHEERVKKGGLETIWAGGEHCRHRLQHEDSPAGQGAQELG